MERDHTQGAAPEMAALVDAFENLQQEWLRAAGEMAEQTQELLAEGQATPDAQPGPDAGPAGRDDLARVTGPLLRAQVAWLEGGLRYMGRLSQTHGNCLPALYRRLAEASTDGLDERGRRELNDEARAYLRQLADVSLQEARVLQQRLAELELGLREPPAQGAAGKPRRNVRAKD